MHVHLEDGSMLLKTMAMLGSGSRCSPNIGFCVITFAQVDTFQQFRRSLTPTYTTPNAGTDVTATYLSLNSCGFDSNPTETTQGSMSLSNKHVPGRQDATTWNRFFWLIQYAVGQVGASYCTCRIQRMVPVGTACGFSKQFSNVGLQRYALRSSCTTAAQQI
jgi:hypothetical protein